jgi:hypothetical protein
MRAIRPTPRLALVGTLLLLTISSFLFYYASGDGLRNAVSWAHLALGLSLPVTLGLHIWRAHRRMGRIRSCRF